MIYIPILKTLKEEYSIAKEMQYCFSEKIIPLFEIIAEKFNADEDIITLQNINAIVCGKTAFIDYFLFDIEEQKPSSKFMEIEEIKEFGLKAKIILILKICFTLIAIEIPVCG